MAEAQRRAHKEPARTPPSSPLTTQASGRRRAASLRHAKAQPLGGGVAHGCLKADGDGKRHKSSPPPPLGSPRLGGPRVAHGRSTCGAQSGAFVERRLEGVPWCSWRPKRTFRQQVRVRLRPPARRPLTCRRCEDGGDAERWFEEASNVQTLASNGSLRAQSRWACQRRKSRKGTSLPPSAHQNWECRRWDKGQRTAEARGDLRRLLLRVEEPQTLAPLSTPQDWACRRWAKGLRTAGARGHPQRLLRRVEEPQTFAPSSAPKTGRADGGPWVYASRSSWTSSTAAAPPRGCSRSSWTSSTPPLSCKTRRCNSCGQSTSTRWPTRQCRSSLATKPEALSDSGR